MKNVLTILILVVVLRLELYCVKATGVEPYDSNRYFIHYSQLSEKIKHQQKFASRHIKFYNLIKKIRINLITNQIPRR